MPPYPSENDEGIGRRQLLAAALFVGMALAALFVPPASQQQVAAFLRATVLQPFILTQETLARNRLRTREADALQMRFDSVVGVLANQTTLAEENARLRSLLDLSDRAVPEYRAANVTRPGTQGSESMYLLDIGQADGVRMDSPVVSRNGLVGVVREVQGASAVGVDWTHPDFRVSAMTIDGEIYGMIEPRRGDFREEDRLLLNGVPYHTTLDEGTLVVTSGLGGIYPRGIPLGHVHSLAEAEAGWRRSYWIEPAVRPGSVTHVLVAVEPGEEEQPRLSGGSPAEPAEADGGEVVDRSELWEPDSLLPERGDARSAPVDSISDFIGAGG